MITETMYFEEIKMEIDIQLDPKSRHVHLPVKINDDGPFYFTLDTGAVATTITPELLERLGIESQDDGFVDLKKPKIPHKYAKLPTLTIGSITLENEEVMVIDIRAIMRGVGSGLHSVLGHTTLKNYVMTLNYKTE
ncbi:MAG: hypothetical protein FK733_06440, partial [Asgard group archaeon]|nr:hypothetical protein [Asgard group archaeon]